MLTELTISGLSEKKIKKILLIKKMRNFVTENNTMKTAIEVTEHQLFNSIHNKKNTKKNTKTRKRSKSKSKSKSSIKNSKLRDINNIYTLKNIKKWCNDYFNFKSMNIFVISPIKLNIPKHLFK